VDKLDRVPLPVEAARIGATGWQVTRTGARVVTKLAGRGSLQQKVVREIPQTFADLGPPMSSSVRSSRPARVHSANRSHASSAACSTACHPQTPDQIHKLFVEDLGDEPRNLFKSFDDKPFASDQPCRVPPTCIEAGITASPAASRPRAISPTS
jgi:ubiquinone biosynthesis protein